MSSPKQSSRTLLAIALLFKNALALDTINYAAYAPSATYVVAHELGFFSHYNVSVNYHSIITREDPGNIELLFSDYDVMSVTMDEALDVTLNRNQQVKVLGQVDAGPELVLVASEGVSCFEDLRDGTVFVEGAQAGYAYATQMLMESNGLWYDDYSTQVVPTITDRYALLQTPNSTYATIMAYPDSTIFVEENNLTVLSSVAKYIDPYSHMTLVTSNLATTSTPTYSNSTAPSPLTNFYTAMLAANEYLSIKSSELISITAISSYLNISASSAYSAYNAAVNSASGEIGGGGPGNFTVDLGGLDAVVGLRRQFEGFAELLIRHPTFDFESFVYDGAPGVVGYGIRDAALKNLDGWEPYLG